MPKTQTSYTSRVVSFIYDDFIEDKPIWVATLSNGQRVYQDDDRNGSGPAWLRLKNLCEHFNLKITHIHLRLRSHWEMIPENKDGYAFRKCAGCEWGGQTQHFYHLGYLDGSTFKVQKWSVPEFILISEEERNIDDYLEVLIK